MLDIDEPTTGSQQVEDIFIHGSFAVVWLVMDGIPGHDRIERAPQLGPHLPRSRPRPDRIVQVDELELVRKVLELEARLLQHWFREISQHAPAMRDISPAGLPPECRLRSPGR